MPVRSRLLHRRPRRVVRGPARPPDRYRAGGVGLADAGARRDAGGPAPAPPPRRSARCTATCRGGWTCCSARRCQHRRLAAGSASVVPSGLNATVWTVPGNGKLASRRSASRAACGACSAAMLPSRNSRSRGGQLLLAIRRPPLDSPAKAASRGTGRRIIVGPDPSSARDPPFGPGQALLYATRVDASCR